MLVSFLFKSKKNYKIITNNYKTNTWCVMDTLIHTQSTQDKIIDDLLL